MAPNTTSRRFAAGDLSQAIIGVRDDREARRVGHKTGLEIRRHFKNRRMSAAIALDVMPWG